MITRPDILRHVGGEDFTHAVMASHDAHAERHALRRCPDCSGHLAVEFSFWGQRFTAISHEDRLVRHGRAPAAPPALWCLDCGADHRDHLALTGPVLAARGFGCQRPSLWVPGFADDAS